LTSPLCANRLLRRLFQPPRETALVIAKLDRLSRNLGFIAALMESGVEFVAVDNPHANNLTVHILAAVAEHERKMISERTEAALAIAMLDSLIHILCASSRRNWACCPF
jgi:DNA invertase Pin-like site-specific DNA recombinase